MEKMTKRNVYEALINYAKSGEMKFSNGDEVIEVTAEALAAFAQNEIELLDKKAAKAKERAAVKKAEGDELTAVVKTVMSSDNFETIADIAAKVSEIDADATVAKVSYRLTQLVNNGEAAKSEITIDGGEGQKKRKLMAYKLV